MFSVVRARYAIVLISVVTTVFSLPFAFRYRTVDIESVLPSGAARFFFGGVAIRYLLPVFQMSSSLHIMVLRKLAMRDSK